MILDLFKLDKKVAIVTGANTGLGQGIALGLAEAGADIVGVGRSDMSETGKMVEELGKEFFAINADLVSVEPVQRIIEDSVQHFGHVDILVNNAGIIRRNPAIDYTEKDWDDTNNTNLKTSFFLSQAAAKQFIKQGTGGKVINIASLLSFQGGILVPAYTASKSGVMGFTRAVANEWMKYGINVNAIAPGYMATSITGPLRADDTRNSEILARIPAGRWGTPQDLKGVAVFLASNASDYLTGFTIAVDGGWLSR
ncbi:MAG: 2-dehydro-3-deoxy-D-gluconate 5-dehydrogenase KduD [Desulfitobacteriaceae bacterium]